MKTIAWFVWLAVVLFLLMRMKHKVDNDLDTGTLATLLFVVLLYSMIAGIVGGWL